MQKQTELPRGQKELAPLQSSLPGICPITDAVEILALTEGIESRGAVFTRREVVEFLLDLAGYTPDKPLHRMRLLEPCFGRGDFLLPAIERLLAAWKAFDGHDPVRALMASIKAVEVHRLTFFETRNRVIELLGNHLDSATAISLADAWLVNGDFLLTDFPHEFDVAIGNPPYVRQELIPNVLLNAYRDRYVTIYDRADLYVPFIERSLQMLVSGGHLGFICADRWMKNRYGGPLRKMIAEGFHLKIYVDMVNTPAFHSDVIAYPAITIVSRSRPGPTRIASRPLIQKKALAQLSRELLDQGTEQMEHIQTVESIARNGEPWILETSDQLALVRRLESDLPTIEEALCKIGIGVATGADRAFIGPMDELDVEDDRKLPLAMTRDIQDGTVKWRGLGVINPFSDTAGLVKLSDYPRLKRYLEERKDQIAGRHCARKAPANWYRTIDRITPGLARQPKLLIPDIKDSAHIVYEDGQLYPHHNLYYITSQAWDLRALQAVLLSSVTRLFIETYSTRMRGGFLRFQAQYLRRLRLPRWETVPQNIRLELISAATEMDVAMCDRATFALYAMSKAEISALTGVWGESKNGIGSSQLRSPGKAGGNGLLGKPRKSTAKAAGIRKDRSR